MSSSKRKKERRHERYLRNIQKEGNHKNSAWTSGKLIEENHNRKFYSPEYTKALSFRLCKYLLNASNTGDPNIMLSEFWKYKDWMIGLILKWNPGVQEDDCYRYLKELLEVYWDQVAVNENPECLMAVRVPDLGEEPVYEFKI